LPPRARASYLWSSALPSRGRFKWTQTSDLDTWAQIQFVGKVLRLPIYFAQDSIAGAVHPDFEKKERSKMIGLLGRVLLGSVIADVVHDTIIRDKVSEPAVGGVVYCDLALGMAEHSGIYLGNGEIMHRKKDGVICRASARQFVAGTPGNKIYTSCMGKYPTGYPYGAEQAKFYEQNPTGEGYALLWRNCHIFSSACLTHNAENSDTFLWMLKYTAEKKLARVTGLFGIVRESHIS
jgi:cell wall-associated NlpC family hydrolase